MMFHDSMAEAQDKMTRVCLFLEQHELPPTPLNYQVAYTYVSNNHDALNQAINQAIASKDNIDSILLEQFYFTHLNPGHTTEANLLKEVDQVIDNLHSSSEQTQRQVEQYRIDVEHCANALDINDIATSKRLLNALLEQTQQLQIQQSKFKHTLERARQSQMKNRQRLKKLRQQHIIDPQTGLYKRHYLNQQTQLWMEQDKSLCAIAIQIDNYQEFVDQYGELIGDIILDKVAKKLHKYVVDSGLPARTQKHEFTVLMADIEPETAKLIADKVRSSVEKMRFVSSRSGRQLPPINMSFGIAKQLDETDFNQLARKASQAAHKARSLGQPSFVTGAN